MLMHDEIVLPILCSFGCPFTFRRTIKLPLHPPACIAVVTLMTVTKYILPVQLHAQHSTNTHLQGLP